MSVCSFTNLLTGVSLCSLSFPVMSWLQCACTCRCHLSGVITQNVTVMFLLLFWSVFPWCITNKAHTAAFFCIKCKSWNRDKFIMFLWIVMPVMVPEKSERKFSLRLHYSSDFSPSILIHESFKGGGGGGGGGRSFLFMCMKQLQVTCMQLQLFCLCHRFLSWVFLFFGLLRLFQVEYMKEICIINPQSLGIVECYALCFECHGVMTSTSFLP